ncbi:type II secretion system inner membrane protein GspF [Thiomicrospira microaerophila]|uniref:type II secretion system inner membrane protein GspF n=1 Tax=Thiomicrospira microaerophila TaxID=406020 RepID=UPI00200BCFF5|nr:type II secretion system inner membrane protein GspF [Thiomicrospira microaerophila]UQB41714.1 type II secretion system inner membrane protein GspF [Thiomicrospira microaerophila]
MAVFEYQALTQQGKTQKGLMEGDSERQIRQTLREKGLTPLQLKAVDKKREKARTSANQAWLKRTISIADLSLATRQIATLLEAGMPLTQALKGVASQAETRLMQRFLTSLHSQVSQGYSLAQALSQSPYKVGEDYSATIHAGEESGHLEAVLSRLADTIEQQERLRKKVQSALIYPMLMVVVALAIVFFLMVYVVPKVVSVFDNMSQTLPPLTQGLLSTSEFVQAHAVLMLAGLVVLLILFKWLMRIEKWRFRWHRLLLATPFLGRFLIFGAVAKWSRTLGVLVASGVPLKTALHISSQVMSYLPLRQKVLHLEEEVRKGLALSQAMQQAGVFPALLLNLVQTGENSGQLDSMLLKGASHYEYHVETSSATLVSILEPLLIITMGGVVLTIVLAIMLPIFEMNQMLG